MKFEYEVPAFRKWYNENITYYTTTEEREKLFLSLTNEQLEAFKKDAEEVYNRNIVKYNEYSENFTKAKKAFSEFISGNALKYVTNISKEISYPSNTFKDVILQGVSNAKYNLEKIEEQKKQKNKQEAELKLRDEAIQYLIDNQQKYGVDFTAENALEKANKFAFLKKIADTVKDGELHTFSGDGSCENCEGWDGIDKRCQCGNRRVYWEYSGNFKNMNIYGMAN